MASARFLVEEGIAALFSKTLDKLKLEAEVSPLAQAWPQAVADALAQKPNFVVVLSPASVKALSSCSPAVLTAFRTGSLRLALWGAPSAMALKIPALSIPLDRGDAVARAVLLHLSRAALPGAQGVLGASTEASSASGSPPLPEVYTERVYSDAEIGRKLDRAFAQAFASGKPQLRQSSKLMMRLGVSTCLAAAFADESESANSRRRSQAATFQMGVAESYVAYTIRWSTNQIEQDHWSKPKFPLQALGRFCDAFWIQLVRESKEVEIVLIFARASKPQRQADAAAAVPPLGIDVFTNARLEAFGKEEVQEQVEQVEFKPMVELPEVEEEAPSEASPTGEEAAQDVTISGTTQHIVEEKIKVEGKVEEQDDAATTVKGTTQKIKDETIKVEGKQERPFDEAKRTVTGTTEKRNNLGKTVIGGGATQPQSRGYNVKVPSGSPAASKEPTFVVKGSSTGPGGASSGAVAGKPAMISQRQPGSMGQPAGLGSEKVVVQGTSGAVQAAADAAAASAAVAESAKKAAEVELSALKNDHERQANVLKRVQEQSNTLAKKLSETMESERKALLQVKQLEFQLAQAKSGKNNGDSMVKKELEGAKKTIDTIKAREAELLKKFSAAMEENKKLQTEVKALKLKKPA